MKTITSTSGKEIRIFSWEEWRLKQETKPKYGIVKAKNKSKDHVRVT